MNRVYKYYVTERRRKTTEKPTSSSSLDAGINNQTKFDRIKRVVSHLRPSNFVHIYHQDHDADDHHLNHSVLLLNESDHQDVPRTVSVFNDRFLPLPSPINPQHDNVVVIHPIRAVSKLVEFIRNIYNVLEMMDEDDQVWNENQMEKPQIGPKQVSSEKVRPLIGFELDNQDEQAMKQLSEEKELKTPKRETVVHPSNAVDSFLYRMFLERKSTLTEGQEEEHEKEKTMALDQHGDEMTTIDRPLSSSIITLFIESILSVLKTVSILTLLTVSYLHNRFELYIKPIIVVEFRKLEQSLSILIGNLKKYFSVGTNAKLTIARILAKIRQNNPRHFYVILSLYLRTKNWIHIPKSWINQMIWIITSIYFNILLFSIYLFEKVASPRLLYLLGLSNEKLMDLLEKVIVFINNYYQIAINNDKPFTLVKQSKTTLPASTPHNVKIQGTEN